jgi:hypothetical protein
MKVFRFVDTHSGATITKYNSLNATVSHILKPGIEASVVCIHIGQGGVLGYHPAVKDQLFLVIHGDGWVRAERSSDRVAISAGRAAFWKAGEWHESNTETGMTALVIEGDGLVLSELTELLPY